MLGEIAEAIRCQDYPLAEQLLEQFRQQDPHNPWILFYAARLDEVNGNQQAAGWGYRLLLRQGTTPQLIAQARQRLDRLAAPAQQKRPSPAKARQGDSEGKPTAVLVLEPIPAELKRVAALKFAEIMQIDPYSARLQLPSRAWRLYRVGLLAKLQELAQRLQQEEIPNFCAPIPPIVGIEVYQVQYFAAVHPQAIAICKQQQGQLETFTFDWSEVSQQVEGQLPLFESCVDVDLRRQLQRKTKTLDHAKFCDLHLPGRNAILRLGDQQYQFQQGIALASQSAVSEIQGTAQEYWQSLHQFLEQVLPGVPIYSEFTPFAETAIDFREMLKQIEPHINLLRREETPWDAAFHLYSGLLFWRKRSELTQLK